MKNYIGELRRRSNRQIEQHEQAEVARWLREKGVFFTASAGGARTSIGTGKKLKMAGYRRGCPDLLIFEPRDRWHGLFIELKRPEIPENITGKKIPKGLPSPDQKDFETSAIMRGYQFRFCWGSDDAITQISNYLDQ